MQDQAIKASGIKRRIFFMSVLQRAGVEAVGHIFTGFGRSFLVPVNKKNFCGGVGSHVCAFAFPGLVAGSGGHHDQKDYQRKAQVINYSRS